LCQAGRVRPGRTSRACLGGVSRWVTAIELRKDARFPPTVLGLGANGRLASFVDQTDYQDWCWVSVEKLVRGRSEPVAQRAYREQLEGEPARIAIGRFHEIMNDVEIAYRVSRHECLGMFGGRYCTLPAGHDGVCDLDDSRFK
jgi:hypothetical protein